MLQEIPGHPGLYEMDQSEMPYGPSELSFPLYVLPMTFGRGESEEAAARFIAICQRLGRWCGVTTAKLNEQLKAELQAHGAFQEAEKAYWRAKAANEAELERFERASFWWCVALVLTLGVAWFFLAKPQMPRFASCQRPVFEPASHTLILQFGPGAVYQGMRELMDRHGALRYEVTNEGQEDHMEVTFPTPALLGPLARYRKQAVPA